MKNHITILVPDGQVNIGTLATVAGVFEIFNGANAYAKRNGKQTFYKIQTAGVSKAVNFSDDMFTLRPQVNISAIRRTDLVVVPPSAIRSGKELEKGNKTIANWIVKQHRAGAEVASMCSGIFMLASSGILSGRTCSAHWAHAGIFRNAFPGIDLQEDKLITFESGIYTNGGAYSFLNLAIFLVEKYYDRQTAVYCAKMFQVDISRQAQSPFTIFSGQKNHGDEAVLRAQEYLERHYREKISIELLSKKLAVGRRNFDRRFIKATGITPLDYLQRVKVEAAKKDLESTRKTVNEVMFEVGYNDTKAFREVFSRVTGMSPVDYKLRYNLDGLGARV